MQEIEKPKNIVILGKFFKKLEKNSLNRTNCYKLIKILKNIIIYIYVVLNLSQVISIFLLFQLH